MTDPDEAIRRGQRAQQILEDDVFKDGVKLLRDAALAEFKAALPTDVPALQTARIRFGLLESLVSELDQAMKNGRFEKRKQDMDKPPLKPGEAYNGRHGVQ